MKYYATIYIKNMQIPSIVPHTFLGLTHTHPDGLDKLGDIEMEKYKDDYLVVGQFVTKSKGKWYENIYPSILSDEFQGEGFWGFGPESKIWKSGKVFENNQYNHEPHENTRHFNDSPYKKTNIRSLSTFQSNNRCVFEISKEQYEKLLELIKKDVLVTLYIHKESNAPINQELKYDLTNNNYTTWVLHKLDSIGIEVIDLKEWLPDIIPNQHPQYIMTKLALKQALDIELNLINTLKDSFQDLAYYHFVFRKFQNIDKDLESIKGAKAFREWTKDMIGNRFVCKIEQNYNRLSKHDIICSSEDEGLVATLQLWKEKLQHIREQLRYVYAMLDRILSSQIQKAKNLGYKDIQGSFTFISYDKQSHKIMLRSQDKNYEPYGESQLDPSIPMNNWTLNQYTPYIFNPKNPTLAKCLYKNHHYPCISQGYVESLNKSYLAILSGKDDISYWSISLHKLRKSIHNGVALNA